MADAGMGTTAGGSQESGRAVFGERCWMVEPTHDAEPLTTLITHERGAEVRLSWGDARSPELWVTRTDAETGAPRAVAFSIGDTTGVRALADALLRLADAADADEDVRFRAELERRARLDPNVPCPPPGVDLDTWAADVAADAARVEASRLRRDAADAREGA
jgi:hypothetical protein